MKRTIHSVEDGIQAQKTIPREMPRVVSPLIIDAQVKGILENKVNIPMATLEQAERYHQERLARPDIVIEVAEAAIARSQIERLCDDRVRTRVISAALDELEAIFDHGDIALNRELSREELPLSSARGAVSGATFASA